MFKNKENLVTPLVETVTHLIYMERLLTSSQFTLSFSPASVCWLVKQTKKKKSTSMTVKKNSAGLKRRGSEILQPPLFVDVHWCLRATQTLDLVGVLGSGV